MDDEKLQQEFESRIVAIHNPNNNDDTQPRDIRREEFEAMTNVFLGDDFDQDKISQVEHLQDQLHQTQAVLYLKLEANEISPEEYVDTVNTLIRDTFMRSESILGKNNFIKLFGAPPSEVSGFIDKETFIQDYRK